ncbi:MAG: NCS1 family nucleobase:cation symporter-1 [Pirellulales bacterium]
MNPYDAPAAPHCAYATDDGIYELTTDVSASPYYNADVAPTTLAERKWGTRDVAALWVGMCACIPSYMLASGLIEQGMNWWQAALTVTLGNVIILLPMMLNAHAGTKFGIPFPVYCRVSFGIRGANVAAMLRALVACGWFGIQTWIGGQGIYVPLTIFFPDFASAPILFDGINLAEFACFLTFWAMTIYLIYAGMDSIRIFMNLATPILVGVPILLLWWAIDAADGLEPILHAQTQLTKNETAKTFGKLFVPGLTAIVGFWSTLALNIPDFMRYAKSQRAQMLGQAIGLPTTMGLYALVGVLVTSATIVVYKTPIWDPIQLLKRFEQPWVQVVAMIALAAATLSTNIAANVVGPANDFANLAPKWISFKTGGLITGIIGIVIQPWKLLADADKYFGWLTAYSALLGAICGILIVDYFVVRKRWIDLPELYLRDGKYWYLGGFNPIAFAAFVCGVVPCLPGFLGKVGVIEMSPDSVWIQMYGYAWFISFAIAGAVYGLAMKPTAQQQAALA